MSEENAVSLKRPEFLAAEVQVHVWFAQDKALFTLGRIVSDNTMYYVWFAHDEAQFVGDYDALLYSLCHRPDSCMSDKYDVLKQGRRQLKTNGITR